jgi:hypothetical protein
MLDTAVLASITQQMTSNKVPMSGKDVPVRRTSRQQLRTLAFPLCGREYRATEENAEKPSRWGTTGTGGASGRTVQGLGNQKIRGGRG